MNQLDGPIYIYSGEGAWPVSVDQTQSMMESHFDSRGIKQVNSLDVVDKGTRVVVIPGGSVVHMVFELGITQAKLSQYVENGGKFLGICAGGILATKFFASKPTSPRNPYLSELHARGKLYSSIYDQSYALSLYPGKCIAPHIVKNTEASNPENFCAVDVFYGKDNFKISNYSGPAFWDVPANAQTLLWYSHPIDVQKVQNLGERGYKLTEEKINEMNPVAALSYPLERGRVVLSGVHPEIDPATFSECARKHGFPDDLPENLLESDPSRKAFIDRIFNQIS